MPVGPGGSSDLVARLVADRLAAAIARPVVVENRPGATGRIAVDALRSAAPAGDTFLVAPIAVPVIAPLAFRRLAYSAEDLNPVSQLATFDYALAVSAQSAFRTLADFVAWARGHGDAATFGATGAGTVPHFLGTHLAQLANYRIAFASYASIGKLESDLAGGHLMSAVSATPDFASLHRAGKIRILATSGRTRSPLLPDVPTFRELGYPQMEARGWTGAFTSARAPAPLIDAMSIALQQVLSDPDVREKLRAAGLEPTGTTPQALAGIVAADTAYWAPIIRASGFVADGAAP